MVHDSRSPILQVEEKKKRYTSCDVKRADSARQFQHITSQPINRILHAVDNNILQNLPIMREGIMMTEDNYGPSVPHFQGKIFVAKFSMLNLSLYQVPQGHP